MGTDPVIVDTADTSLRGRLAVAVWAVRILAAALLAPVTILFHGAYSPLLWVVTLWPRVKVVSILQGSELNTDFRGVRALLITLILRRSSLVVCRNDAQCQEAQRLCRVRADKCHVVHWGLDPSLFTGSRSAPGEEIVIVSPRATQTEYNIPVVFDAIRQLKRDGHKVRFVYVRFNSHFAVDGRGAVDQEIDSPPQTLLWNAIGAADLCVTVPSYDGLSNTVLETLALGTLPVFSDLPAYSFLHEDPKLGMPVALSGDAAQDAQNLRGVLATAIRDIDGVREGATFRRNYASAHYQEGTGVERLLQALRA